MSGQGVAAAQVAGGGGGVEKGLQVVVVPGHGIVQRSGGVVFTAAAQAVGFVVGNEHAAFAVAAQKVDGAADKAFDVIKRKLLRGLYDGGGQALAGEPVFQSVQTEAAGVQQKAGFAEQGGDGGGHRLDGLSSGVWAA